MSRAIMSTFTWKVFISCMTIFNVLRQANYSSQILRNYLFNSVPTQINIMNGKKWPKSSRKLYSLRPSFFSSAGKKLVFLVIDLAAVTAWGSHLSGQLSGSFSSSLCVAFCRNAKVLLQSRNEAKVTPPTRRKFLRQLWMRACVLHRLRAPKRQTRQVPMHQSTY